MTYSERQTLGHNIKFLDMNQLKGIVDIMRDTNSNKDSEVLEFDLNSLSDLKCRELQKYVNNCLNPNATIKKKVNQQAQGQVKQAEMQYQQQQ